MTWFEKKFNSEKWWEIRLKLVAKSLGLTLSLYSVILAHYPYIKRTFGNWRYSQAWLRHLDDIAKHGAAFDVGF